MPSSRLCCSTDRESTGRADLGQLLRALGFGGWSRGIGFNLKSPAAWAPNRRVSLSCEALKPGRLLLSSYESPRWHLPIEGCLVYTENLLFSAATFLNYLSWVFWVTCCSLPISTCCLTCTLLSCRCFFPWFSWTNLRQRPTFLLQLPHPSAITELKRVRACFWTSIWLMGCGWFELPSRPLKLSPHQ